MPPAGGPAGARARLPVSRRVWRVWRCSSRRPPSRRVAAVVGLGRHPASALLVGPRYSVFGDRPSAARPLRASGDHAVLRRRAASHGERRDWRDRAPAPIAISARSLLGLGYLARLWLDRRLLGVHLAARALFGDARRDAYLRQPDHRRASGMAVRRRVADAAHPRRHRPDPGRGDPAQGRHGETDRGATRRSPARSRCVRAQTEPVLSCVDDETFTRQCLPIGGDRR